MHACVSYHFTKAVPSSNYAVSTPTNDIHSLHRILCDFKALKVCLAEWVEVISREASRLWFTSKHRILIHA